MLIFLNIYSFVVAYEVPWSVVSEYPSTHPQKLLNYVFNLMLTPIEAGTGSDYKVS